MALIQSSDKLCDVITSSIDIIPVLNRFGIILGTGDLSIKDICKKHNLDTDFFLCIINTYVNEEYFPEKALKSFCATTIISYLEKTNNFYVNFQLPNIERHFMSLLSRSGENNNLGVMMKFFAEVKGDIISRINNDRQQWYPAIKMAEQGTRPDEEVNIDTSDAIIDKLNDLKNMFIIHLNGQYDSNLCYGVIVAITAMEREIKQNDRIRNRILLPLYNSILEN